MKLAFIALSASKDLFINTDTEPAASLFHDLLQIMTEKLLENEDGPLFQIKTFHQNTIELREQFEKLITEYSRYNPQVFQLRSYFQKLKEGEFFAFYPSDQINTEKRQEITHKLFSLRDNEPLDLITHQHDAHFGELIKQYEIKGKDENIHQGIGEKDKSKRICRFCKRSSPEVTFKNIAHAIAESLGNKNLILNEECDSCNSQFGSASGIERALITYLKPYTTFFGIKGKKGVPKLKGEDFELKFVNNGGTNSAPPDLTGTDNPIPPKSGNNGSEHDGDTDEKTFSFNIKDKIVWQDLYRTLCKYAISIMEKEDVLFLDKTISWINREFIARQLPSIAILESSHFFKRHPSLMYYIRKNDDKRLPFLVGEFHHTYFTFVFIIPFAAGDESSFIDQPEYSHFWTAFKHFNSIDGWTFKNASNSEESNYHVLLNFTQVKKDND